MKKTLLLWLLLNGVLCYGQEATPGNQLTREDYLKKSKNQKTVAWVLLGGGAAMAVAGGIWFGESFSIDIFGPDEDNSEGAAGAVMVAGVAAMVASIPLFISSARNKGRAEKVSIGFVPEQLSAMATRFYRGGKHYPAVGVRINF
ncbi:MAG: hypothetical protein IPH18_03310 [Chitinophagaceae bacterium]|nr:hypothetical protein [Chitinophagaceae bacterium]MBK8951874.1 hypothetical protein [Chitinophagaceae bacterium]